MTYLPHPPERQEEMLKKLGLSKVEDLYSHVDPELLFKGELALGEPLSELEIENFFKRLAGKNKKSVIFAGAGAYDRFIPAAVDQLVLRGEFLTAYTPYQPEVSQGTLAAIFEYQTIIARLTGMEVANASMYDGASALAEAVLMARAVKGRGRRVLLSSTLHPFYRQTVKTYLAGYGDPIEELPYTEEGTTDLEALERALKKGEVHALALPYLNLLFRLRRTA